MSADWPQWRGPSRDAHAAPGGPPITALPKELKPVWKIAVGPGFSSPIVVGNKVVYTSERDGKEVAHCLDATTGKELWSTPYANSAGDEWGTGPRSTPFVSDTFLFVQSMDGEFRCLNLADGTVRWGVAFKDYGISFVGSKGGEGTAARRGNNGSGVAEGDYVYVPVGAKGASIVCFNKRDGREVWKALDDEAAYSSFIVATFAGTKQLVAFTADALVGLDLRSGQQFWRVPFRTGAKRHAASPVVIGPDALTVNSQTIGMVATKVSRENDTWKTTQLWANKQLNINLATPVFVEGHLYSQGGVGAKTLVCVNASTGDIKWSQPGFGRDVKDYASVIALGRQLLVLTYDGQLLLIDANPRAFTELARVQVCGNTWSHPAYVDGKLYVRDGRDLQCFDLVPREVASR